MLTSSRLRTCVNFEKPRRRSIRMSLEINNQAQEPSEPTTQTEPIIQIEQIQLGTPTNQPDQPRRKRRRRRSFSQKAADASRRNGAKSNGPTTSEGKTRRNRASLIHGAFSSSDLILPEDQDRYNAIFNDYIQLYRPSCDLELEIIEQMVSASWRRRRHSAIGQQYWNQAITELALDPANKGLSRLAIATKAHSKLHSEKVNLTALEVSEYRESRRFLTALRNLRDHEKHTAKSKITIDPGID